MNEYCSKLNQYGLLWLTRYDLVVGPARTKNVRMSYVFITALRECA